MVVVEDQEESVVGWIPRFWSIVVPESSKAPRPTAIVRSRDDFINVAATSSSRVSSLCRVLSLFPTPPLFTY